MAARHEPPHPLAEQLAAAVGTDGELLDLGTGGGRNLRFLAQTHRALGVDDDAERAARVTAALRADHLDVQVAHAAYTQLPFAARRFSGCVATHALLHGTRAKVRLAIAEASRVMRSGSPFFLTLASVRDNRYGEGSMVEIDVFAPTSGDEAGVPHLYVDAGEVARLLAPHFSVVSLREVDADAIAGRWAHGEGAAAGRRHWFVEARRR
ncbi:MAG: class I SAM-dependent methyltransferase [bacterium]|nr:class I SAM-dependent methyltransferase [bacterium]